MICETHTDTQVSIDGSITSSAGQVLILPIWDVEVGLGVTVLLGQTEINDIDLVATLANTHEEVVRLDIAVDEGLGVDIFNAGDKLIGKEKHCLQGELAVAEIEEIFQAGSQEIHNHCIVITLGTEPADKRDANASGERLVDTSLIFKLWVFRLDTFEFDGNLLARDDVGSEVDITETAAANLPANAVFIADAKILCTGTISILISALLCVSGKVKAKPMKEMCR